MENNQVVSFEGMNMTRNMLRALPVQEREESFFPAAAYPAGDQIRWVSENHVPSPGFSLGSDLANSSWPRVSDYARLNFQLESDFSSLNLSDATRQAGYMVAQPDYGDSVYTGGDPVNSLSKFDWPPEMGFAYTDPQVPIGSLQRLRAQSAANGNMGLFGPHNYIPYNNLENSNLFSVNSNFNTSSPYFSDSFNSSPNLNRNFHRNGFRLPENRNWCPNFERVNLLMVAKHQHGSRLLQKKLLQGTPEEKKLIFSGLEYHVCDLMVDQFGKYLVQTMFEVCSLEQMDRLLLPVTLDLSSLFNVCDDICGTKAMQKMLEHLKMREQIAHVRAVLSALTRITVVLSKSKAGQHVIHHCLRSFCHEETKHILNEVASHCVEIAMDQHGCRVLKQCVFHAQGELHDRMVGEIAANSVLLAQHPYGNYVLQYLVELKIPHVTAAVLEQLSGYFVALSLNKYGSHVVELLMKNAVEDKVKKIIKEIINSPNFLTVLQDPYGNFVAQSALKFSKGSILHKNMVSLILNHYQFLHVHPHGQRVLTKIKGCKILGDCARNFLPPRHL